MKYSFYIMTLLGFITSNVFAQTLTKVKLNKLEDSSGVVGRYEYRPKESHDFINLWLYKNGEYHYEEGSLTKVLFNKGKWKLLKNELILFDRLNKDNLPVSLTCLNKTDSTNTFKIQIIRNLKGEYLTDGFVYINNDSNQCLPLTGTCLEKYKNIDSVKVVFENGFKSKWIPVLCQYYKQLSLTLQSNLLMSNYTALRHYKFQVFKSYLKPKD